MFRDLFDRLHAAAVVIVLVVIALLLGGFAGAGDAPVRHRPNPSLERAMQEQARASFLLETFQPVEAMITAGRHAEALLKLQEFEKQYPGEPHTLVLRGTILLDQNALGEGISQYAAAVKLNGDYVDAKSSLHRRDEISELVDSAIPEIRNKLQSGNNPTLAKSLQDLYYLQSRLAGGCE